MEAPDRAVVPPAVAQLIAALRTALAAAVTRIAELEAEVATLRAGRASQPPTKTPTNSSVPPAKGWKARRVRAAPDGPPARRGPKPGHPGVSRMRARAERVDVVLSCRPSHCDHCRAALPTSGGRVVARRQVVELPPVRPVVVEAQVARVRCRHCGHGTTSQYPDGFGTTGMFGPRLVATAAVLHEEHHVAYARLVELFGGLFGLTVSEGALVEAVGRLGRALVPAAEVIGAEVRTAAVIGSDETSARVDGVTYWEWVFQTATAAYHCIVRRRNTAVVLAFLNGVIPQAWVSDLWKPQLKAGAVLYQICLAHQLRDLTYAVQAETGDKRAAARAWAAAMAALVRRAIHTRNTYAVGQMADACFVAEVAVIEHECDTLLAQPLTAGWSYDLQTRFLTHRRGLLTFLHHLDVPPTNNASERSLRPSVVHRKVTGGFRSETFAQGYAALRTVADTARKRGATVFATLLTAAGIPLPISSQYTLAHP